MTGFDLPLMLRLVRSGCYVGVPLGQRMLVGKDGFLVIPYPTQGLWMLFMAWWAKLRYTKILIKKNGVTRTLTLMDLPPPDHRLK
jgi:hypothetical protein